MRHKNIFFTIAALLLAFIMVTQSPALTATSADQTMRAFSLKELHKKIQADNSPEITRLLSLFCGITVVEGYMLSKDDKDIIIFGHVDTGKPFIHTEDFIVALRNAWMKYAELKGDTYYYTNPGCSIDPDPHVLGQLNAKAAELMNNADMQTIDDQIEQWHDICSQPQTVRVFGIPFHSHFGNVMVEADYLLKRLVDGSADPGVEGFTSLIKLTKQNMEKDILASKPLSVAVSSMNRFWFFPGENQYTCNDHTVTINQSPVTLLTESQYLHSSGKSLVGTGTADTLAQEFTSNFTLLYRDIAEKEPIFYELEALFRLVALAKVMSYNEIDKTINLDYWLNDFIIQEKPVDPVKKGISNIERFEHRRETEESIEVIKLWLPSCGGVGIEIEVSEKNMLRDTSKKLEILEEKILQSRPTNDALFWDVN